MNKKILAMLSSVVLLCTACSLNDPTDTNNGSAPKVEYTEPEETFNVTVDFLKVGKADACVIATENHVVVIDCGEEDDGGKVCSCIESLGRDTVDYLIITHYDKDHVGGAAEVFNSFEVSHVIGADYVEESAEYSKLDKAMKSKGVQWELLKSSETSFYVDDVYFEIYPCEKESYKDGNDNNHSLVIKAIHHDEVFIFAGDAMQERLEEIMDIGDCDVLKEPYHGREIANLGEFLDKVTPEYAVVSTSDKYYDDKTADELEKRNIQTFLTFDDGNIRCTSTGSSLSFKTDYIY